MPRRYRRETVGGACDRPRGAPACLTRLAKIREHSSRKPDLSLRSKLRAPLKSAAGAVIAAG